MEPLAESTPRNESSTEAVAAVDRVTSETPASTAATPAGANMMPSSSYSPLSSGLGGPALDLLPYEVPENFSMVARGVYRSGFPKKKHFPFLTEKLKLKSILFLAPEVFQTPEAHLHAS